MVESSKTISCLWASYEPTASHEKVRAIRKRMKNEETKSLSPTLLSDDELLARLLEILEQSRRVESVLVAHIAEVDARGIYAREGSPSMYRYCIDALHLSEAEAYLRIGTARASRRYPVLSTMLEDGRLHLTAIAKLSPYLTDDNVDELLRRATHKTKKQVLELIAEIAPKPDVRSTIRKIPTRPAQKHPSARLEPTNELRLDAVLDCDASSTGKASSPPRVDPPAEPARKEPDLSAAVEPLAPERYKVQFTASVELRDKLAKLAALMPGADLASMVDAAVTEKLERLEAKRYGKTKRPRKSVDEADTSPGVRGVAAPVKRVVWERDGGRCTFETTAGKRCSERDRLQFHHEEPYAVGGDRSAENIRLLCHAHNRYMAELDYGKDKMDRYRHFPDRAGEPAPSFELRPDAVRLASPAGARAGTPGKHRSTLSASAKPWRGRRQAVSPRDRSC